MKDADRCPLLDSNGCRCLLHKDHSGPHDPSYTPWAEVLELRAERRLAAIRDGAMARTDATSRSTGNDR